MHGDEALLLAHGTASHPAQLLHVPTDAQQDAQVDAQGTDVGAGLAADPEHAQVALLVVLVQLGLVDGADAELALDGGDDGGPLEEGAAQGLEGAGDGLLAAGDGGVEAHDGDVLLAGALLGLDEAGGAVDADDQAAGNLRVEGAAVAGLLDAEHALDPGDDLMAGGVGRLVEVDDAGADVRFDVAVVGLATGGDGGVVCGADVDWWRSG